YVAHLGGGPFASAAVVCLWIAGVRVPQALSSWWAHGLRRTKGFVLVIAATQRLAFLGIVLGAAAAHEGSRASLALFFGLYSLWCFSTGLAFPIWVDLISRAIAPSAFGRALGIRNAVANVVGVAASLWVASLLGRLPFPANFTATFAVGFA